MKLLRIRATACLGLALVVGFDAKADVCANIFRILDGYQSETEGKVTPLETPEVAEAMRMHAKRLEGFSQSEPARDWVVASSDDPTTHSDAKNRIDAMLEKAEPGKGRAYYTEDPTVIKEIQEAVTKEKAEVRSQARLINFLGTATIAVATTLSAMKLANFVLLGANPRDIFLLTASTAGIFAAKVAMSSTMKKIKQDLKEYNDAETALSEGSPEKWHLLMRTPRRGPHGPTILLSRRNRENIPSLLYWEATP